MPENCVCWDCARSSRIVLSYGEEVKMIVFRPCQYYPDKLEMCRWGEGIPACSDCVHTNVPMDEFPCKECIKEHRISGRKISFIRSHSVADNGEGVN